MSDEDMIFADMVVFFQLIFRITHQNAGQLSAVFFAHAHGAGAVVHFDTGFQTEDAGSKSHDGGTPPSCMHEIQGIQDKAGMDPALSLL